MLHLRHIQVRKSKKSERSYVPHVKQIDSAELHCTLSSQTVIEVGTGPRVHCRSPTNHCQCPIKQRLMRMIVSSKTCKFPTEVKAQGRQCSWHTTLTMEGAGLFLSESGWRQLVMVKQGANTILQVL
jgi:hypothetical protein